MITLAPRLAAASALALGFATACPAFLSDDFRTVPVLAPDGGAEQPDTGGNSGTDAGAAGETRGDGGAGGASPSLLSAGSSGSGGSAGTACCTSGWTATAPPDAAFVAREQPAYVAIGAQVFIWGGADRIGEELATGALYDTELDQWADVPSDANTPSARVLSTAVWTGRSVVVWGGGDRASLTDYATGARFDPSTKRWTPMSTTGAPSARRAPFGVWTGSRVLFWGGVTAARVPLGGAFLYDPASDTWTPASTTNEPIAPLNPTVGWTGSTLLVYGGRSGGTSYTGHTDGYDPVMDLWTKYPAGPQARGSAFGGWDGANLVAWGGTAAQIKKDGQHYSLAKGSWLNMNATGAPSARYAPARETGWSGRIDDGTTLVLGGYDAMQTPLTDGAYYDADTNTWTAVAPWPSKSAHLWGVGVWTGTSFFLWGGRTASLDAPSTAGERFRP